jgi:alpha-beta hydrolase superfamily lysophospholipase
MVISKADSDCRAITFTSGRYRLKGYLHLPRVARPPVVIGVHGLFSNCDSPKQLSLADACTRRGVAYFRFDHRGCGCSQGSFWQVTSLENRHADLINAVAHIQSLNETGDQMGLFGSSFGGTVCISVAASETINALVTYAAPIRSHALIKRLEQSNAFPEPDASFARKNLLFDLALQARKVKNILILHGDADELVPLSHAKELYHNAGKSKQLIIQHQGDHPMSVQKHQEQFVKNAVRWFQAHFSLKNA